jgi:hypothetical protein
VRPGERGRQHRPGRPDRHAVPDLGGKPNGTAANTNTDVFVARSTDGGQTWSPARQVTTNPEDQFFPWLSVSPRGTVAIAYNDRGFAHPLIDTSLAQSTDGGASWSLRRVTEFSWNPDLAFRVGLFIGDYNGLDTTASTALPFWTDARFADPMSRATTRRTSSPT